MSKKSYVKPGRIWLRTHPEYNKKWVQDLLAEDPTILGLGDSVLRDRERIQPRASRLDLLLQDLDTQRRYEVEIQVGATDEARIIRTIGYRDIERKRYPLQDPNCLRYEYVLPDKTRADYFCEHSQIIPHREGLCQEQLDKH